MDEPKKLLKAFEERGAGVTSDACDMLASMIATAKSCGQPAKAVEFSYTVNGIKLTHRVEM